MDRGGSTWGRDAALRSLGDAHTVTNAVQTRAGFTPFGQTRWSVDDQARAAAALPCESRARKVYALMGQVEAGQSWGLGVRSGTHFKGGWGPDPAGRYLVRQMGVIVVAGRPAVGVAILSKPASGTFNGGVQALNAVAGWLYGHVDRLPTGRC